LLRCCRRESDDHDHCQHCPILPAVATRRPALLQTGDAAARLKVTIVLNAAELLAVRVPEGRPRMNLRIKLPDRMLVAEVAATSAHRNQKAIRDAGPDRVVALRQGNLVGGDMAKAGSISVLPKASKPTSSQAV
jgi:hypothetical protein